MKNNQQWIIKINSCSYFSVMAFGEDPDKTLESLEKATIFSNLSEAAMKSIASKLLQGKETRLYWQVIPYEEALEDYSKRVYIDPDKRTMKWGNKVNVKEALAHLKAGNPIAYTVYGDVGVLTEFDESEKFSMDILLNAEWFEIIKVEK